MFLLERDSHFTGGERGRPHLLRRHNRRSVCRTAAAAPRDDHRIGGREVVGAGGGRTVLPCFLDGWGFPITHSTRNIFFEKLSEWMQHWPKKGKL